MADESVPEVETKEIPGFGGFYRAGVDGSIWTCRRRGGHRKDTKTAWRKIEGRPHVRSGHLDINLRKPGGVKRLWKVHHLVLWAFVGPAPPNLECRHLNGNPADNRIENLKWGTRLENVHDAIRHGTFHRSMRCVHTPEKYAEVEEGIRAMPGRKLREIAEAFGVPVWLVNYVKNRKMKVRVT